MRGAARAAAAAAVLAFCWAPAGVFGTSAYAAVSTYSSSEYASFSSTAEAGVYFRECMTKRQTDVKLAIPNDSSYTYAEEVDRLFTEALRETGNGSEGDYLRLSVKSYTVSGQSSTKTRRYSFTMDYHTTGEQEEFVEKKSAEVLDSLDLESKNDYEKIGAVYDFVASCADYATDLTEPTIFSAYGALANQSVVCQGYSQLLYKLLTDAGISCRAVLGEGVNGDAEGVDHVWNIAGIDGVYYLLDATWDSNLGGTRHFFLRGSEDFDTVKPYSHVTSTGQADNLVFRPDYTSTEFTSAYPIAKTAYAPPKTSGLGDLDDDGMVTAKDASKLLAAYADLGDNGTFTAEFIAIADVNSNGIVNAVDASYILKYYAATAEDPSLILEDYVKTLK